MEVPFPNLNRCAVPSRVFLCLSYYSARDASPALGAPLWASARTIATEGARRAKAQEKKEAARGTSRLFSVFTLEHVLARRSGPGVGV